MEEIKTEWAEFIDLDVVKTDDRGSIFQFNNRDSSKMLLIKRKKGSVSGRHYHTGKNNLKNPETFILLDGEAEIILRNTKTDEEIKRIIKTPVMVKAYPYVYHEIKAVTDIILIDMNSIDDDKDDTIKER